jgi:4-amino-4-deoxy-L-arabinose transferase-like glycosyltransferase
MEFIGSQFGVFGPIPFAVLVGGAIGLGARRRLQPADLLLLCLAAPPLLTVAAQAFVSRANANWAGVAYIAGSILAAAWLLRWNARRWLIAAVAIQSARPTASSACAAGNRARRRSSPGPARNRPPAA